MGGMAFTTFMTSHPQSSSKKNDNGHKSGKLPQSSGISKDDTTRGDEKTPPTANITLREITGRADELLRSRQSPTHPTDGIEVQNKREKKPLTKITQDAWREKRRRFCEMPVAVSSLVEPGAQWAKSTFASDVSSSEGKESLAAVETSGTPVLDRGLHDQRHLATEQIVIVFGKRLVRDQLTYEYAIRILTLIRHMMTGRIAPTTICFTGGYNGSASLVSEAAAGYLFFRHVCEEIGVDLSLYSIVLEQRNANSRDSISTILTGLKERVIQAHFTFVSSDYHLIRIRDVETYVPRASLLAPLRAANASISYAYAAYPFPLSSDAGIAHRGRCIVAVAELGVFIVAMRDHIESDHLFCEEVFRRFSVAVKEIGKLSQKCQLVSQNSKLGRCLPNAGGGFRQDLREVCENLESSFMRLRKVCRELEPWARGDTPRSKQELRAALKCVIQAEKDIRRVSDPDRPLAAMEWYRLPVAFLGPFFESEEDIADVLANGESDTNVAMAQDPVVRDPVIHSLRDAMNPNDASSMSSSAIRVPATNNPPHATLLDLANRIRKFGTALSEASHIIMHDALQADMLERRAKSISAENERRRRDAQRMHSAPTRLAPERPTDDAS